MKDDELVAIVRGPAAAAQALSNLILVAWRR